MAYEIKDNSGTLFRNEKKSERSPEYSGVATVNGVQFKVAAWVKQSPGKSPFLSMSFTSVEDANAARPKFVAADSHLKAPSTDAQPIGDILSDLPF